MSLGFPVANPDSDGKVTLEQQNGPFGVPERLLTGFQQARSGLKQNHPLENREKMFQSNFEGMDYMMLRNSQGLYAPLTLKLERQVADQIQRLPGLSSSHLMSDILTSRLDTIGFEDILNDPLNAELVGHPHMLMEKRLGL